MPRVYVTDLRHGLDAAGQPICDPLEAAMVFRRFGDIAAAAYFGPVGETGRTMLRCVSPRGNGMCRGSVDVRRDADGAVNWGCLTCGASGVIRGLSGTPFDPFAGPGGVAPIEARTVSVTVDAATMKWIAASAAHGNAAHTAMLTARRVPGGAVLALTDAERRELERELSGELGRDRAPSGRSDARAASVETGTATPEPLHPLDRQELERVALSMPRESIEFLMRRAMRTLDASVLRQWLGERMPIDRIGRAQRRSTDERVEAFAARTYALRYATRNMPQGGVLPEPTRHWLGECAALLEECCEAVRDDTGGVTRTAFEQLFALIESIEIGNLEAVAFVELGPLSHLPFAPVAAMPAYFTALARDKATTAAERMRAVDFALCLVPSESEASRLRELASRIVAT